MLDLLSECKAVVPMGWPSEQSSILPWVSSSAFLPFPFTKDDKVREFVEKEPQGIISFLQHQCISPLDILQPIGSCHLSQFLSEDISKTDATSIFQAPGTPWPSQKFPFPHISDFSLHFSFADHTLFPAILNYLCISAFDIFRWQFFFPCNFSHVSEFSLHLPLLREKKLSAFSSRNGGYSLLGGTINRIELVPELPR